MLNKIKLQEVVPETEFRHIRSGDNLADRLTRPCGNCEPVQCSWEAVCSALADDCLVDFNLNDGSLGTDDKQEDLSDEDDIEEALVINEMSCCVANQDTTASWIEQFLPRVKVSQSADPNCVSIMSQLRSDPSCSQSKFFHLDDESGTLMSRRWNSDEDDTWVVYIPDDDKLKDEVIDRFHRDFGHPGITKTVGLLRGVCDFKGLHRRVKHWISSCSVCCQAKYGRTLTKAISTSKSWVPLLWGVVGADLAGPIKDADGVKHWVLLLVCYISKFVAATVIDSPGTEDVACATIELLNANGWPRVIATDQGSCFMSIRFKQLLAEHNVVHVYTFGFDAARRGWLERPHAEFSSVIRCMTNDRGRSIEGVRDLKCL
ncbi:gag/pol/env polyprotein, putative, partial [Perkinsus marinus ATCC 50983]